MARKSPAVVKARQSRPAGSRRWLRADMSLVSLVAIVLVAGAGYRFVTDPANFAIRKVSVINELRHLDRRELERVVAASIDGNFFTVDMRAIRDRVRRLAWVDQLAIRRVWPQILTMHVAEQVAVARWGSDALVNARGAVFRPPNDDLEDASVPLVELFGPDHRAADVVALYRAAAAQLRVTGLRIKRFGLDERREWNVAFENSDVRLALGGTDITARLERFVSAYPLLASDPARRPAVVDLRYAQGFAVSWRVNDTDAVQATVKPPGREGDA